MTEEFIEGINQLHHHLSFKLIHNVGKRISRVYLDRLYMCNVFVYSRQDTFDLTPLSNPVYDTYTVSQSPSVSFLKKGLYFMAQIFTGTVILLDPVVQS